MTTGQNSTPELQSVVVREEDLNSEAELLKGDDLLHDVVVQAGLVPAGSTDPIAIAKALRKMKRRLDVSPVTKTDLISVSYESANPERSRQVLTTVESLYLAKQRNVRVNDFQVTFFDQQVTLGATLAAGQSYSGFTRTNGVVSAALQRDLTIRRMEDLNQEQMQNFGPRWPICKDESRIWPPNSLSRIRAF